MTLLARILLAVLLGVLTTGILNYFHVLTPTLNVIIGVIVGLVVYFNYDGRLPGRRVA